MQFEKYALRLNAGDFASRSKAKAKPQKREFTSSSTRTIPIGERTWTDVEPGKRSLSDYPVSKKLIHLLRHGSLPRDKDAAIEFWRIKDNLQKPFQYCHHWSDDRWKKHGRRRRKQEKIPVLYWFVRSNLVPPSSSRSFRTQSYWWSYYRAMSLFLTVSSSTIITSDVQSIYIPSSIQNWYLEDKFWATDRQYSFCLLILGTKIKRILTRSTWMNRVLHNTCINHGSNIRTQCIGSTSILLWREDWSSIRLDRTRSFFTKHFQLIVFRKLSGWKLEKSYTRKKMSHLGLLQRFPWNTSGKENWVQKMLDKQRVPNQAIQIQNWIMIERGDPLFAVMQITSAQPLSALSKRLIHVSLVAARTSIWKKKQITIERGRPVVNRDKSSHEQTMLNEVNMDFRIPGLPHSVVKQAENYRVRELVKKIENHPHRQSLQRDLHQNNAYNPFSEKSKKMIQDVGNVQLFETDPTTQFKACLSLELF